MLLNLDKVSRIYRSPSEEVSACNEVSFQLSAGDFVLIMGPSGSGKSTLMNVISGIDRPDSGVVYYQGKRHDQLSDREMTLLRRQFLGLIFQNFELIGPMNVYDNIAYPMTLLRWNRQQRHRRVTEVTAALQIDRLLRRPLAKISGGQQQRVAIARTLALQPKVLLADEITANLDHKMTQLVYQLLQEHAQREQQAVLLVSHDPEARKYASRCYTLSDGRLEE